MCARVHLVTRAHVGVGVRACAQVGVHGSSASGGPSRCPRARGPGPPSPGRGARGRPRGCLSLFWPPHEAPLPPPPGHGAFCALGAEGAAETGSPLEARGHLLLGVRRARWGGGRCWARGFGGQTARLAFPWSGRPVLRKGVGRPWPLTPDFLLLCTPRRACSPRLPSPAGFLRVHSGPGTRLARRRDAGPGEGPLQEGGV